MRQVYRRARARAETEGATLVERETDRDAELLAAAAEAVLTAFRLQVPQDQLPPAATASLRLLAAALALYQDSHGPAPT